MKKIIITIKSFGLILLLTSCFQVNAQLVVDGISLDDPSITFCEVKVTEFNSYRKRINELEAAKDDRIVETQYQLVNRTSEIYIDVGQTFLVGKKQCITDSKDGKELVFESPMGVLNALSQRGWELVNNNTSNYENIRQRDYLLKKKELE